MKIKAILGSLALIATSVLFVSTTPAQAEGCSDTNPCHTYAIVDNSGTVTNVIWCAVSECGSGKFGGEKVVLQTPNSTYGHNSNSQQTVTEQGGTFTVTDNTTQKVTNVITPAVQLEVTAETITSSSIVFNNDAVVLNAKEITAESTTVNSLSYNERQTEEKVIEDLDAGLKLLRKNYDWFRKFLLNWFIM
jgi:hypothetical protein